MILSHLKRTLFSFKLSSKSIPAYSNALLPELYKIWPIYMGSERKLSTTINNTTWLDIEPIKFMEKRKQLHYTYIYLKRGDSTDCSQGV